jgi:hypothetical protein
MSDSENELWAAYVKAVAGDETAQAIADRITERVGQGVSQPTISRWLGGRHSGELKPGNVAAFATAFGRPVLQAFLAAGLLKREDVGTGLTKAEVAFVLELEPPTERVPVTRRRRAPR